MDKIIEKRLIERSRLGDREALGVLCDALTPKLFGYLVNVTGDDNLSKDILQETWLKAISSINDFRPRGGGISAWLFAIARNECRQHWRKFNREVPLDPEQHESSIDSRSEFSDKIMVDRILHLLSENDREILRLKYIADLPSKDIARTLNISLINVRVRVHRALAHARDILNSQTL